MKVSVEAGDEAAIYSVAKSDVFHGEKEEEGGPGRRER